MYNACGVKINEFDYSNDENTLKIFRKYLGNEYIPDNNKYCGIAANHISWVDILYTEKKFSPSFIAKDSTRKIPFLGSIAWGQKSAFIARKDKNAIEAAVNFFK